jgi:hypothetical protein
MIDIILFLLIPLKIVLAFYVTYHIYMWALVPPKPQPEEYEEDDMDPITENDDDYY